LEGFFQELASHAHVERRRWMLGEASITRAIQAHIDIDSAAAPEAVGERLLETMDWNDGVALARFSEPLGNEKLLAIGRALGDIIPERSPDVADFLEGQNILNIVSRFDSDAPAEMRPFSTGLLSLHSESSGHALRHQPHYILLYCVASGDEATSAATVIVPMRGVTERLKATDRAMLQRVRYRQCEEGPMIARETARGLAFSFRDFCGQRLDWSAESDTGGDVNSAIAALLNALYDPDGAAIVRWEPGLMVAIDNFRCFHGRTAALHPSDGQRWLKRVRIGCGTADDGA